MHGQSRAVVKYLGQSQRLSESTARGKAVDVLPLTQLHDLNPFKIYCEIQFRKKI